MYSSREVLGADHDRRRRRAVAGPGVSPRAIQADDDRDPSEIANAALAARRVCFLITAASFPCSVFARTLATRSPLGVTALCNATSASHTPAESAITQSEAPRTPDRR